MTRTLPITFLSEPIAFKTREAAAYLGVSRTTLWLLSNLPKDDKRRIVKTSYGTYARAELDRHLAAEMNRRCA